VAWRGRFRAWAEEVHRTDACEGPRERADAPDEDPELTHKLFISVAAHPEAPSGVLLVGISGQPMSRPTRRLRSDPVSRCHAGLRLRMAAHSRLPDTGGRVRL